MGAVYRGERDDGLFRQSVAVKLVRPTLFSARLAEKFAVERQILASLRHPNIAQLYDGGLDAEGNPWLVMELVEGEPVDAWVRARRCSPRQVLALVRQVCAAAEHAHRNLVVHADIKPGNVFVSPAGQVKLLDFGVARLLDGAEPEPRGPQPLTRAYAAPECRAGEPPTAAADIYSIGVLLHQLLTGELPRESTETVVMPVRDLRGAEIRERLPGDLDPIVRKAMHPEPALRYGSVGAIVEDLNRYLDDLPVRARGDDVWYAARCFARRHRWRLVAAGALAVALVATSVISTALYLRAEAARAAAAARFEEARGMAKFMLFGLPDELARVPGTTPARRRLAEEGRRYLENLARVPDAPEEVALENAVGYRRLAMVLGTPGEPNLGDGAAALQALAAARDELARLLARDPGDRRARLELARNLVLDGRIHWIGDSTAGEADRINEAALVELDALLAADPADAGARVWRWVALAHRADNLNYAGRSGDALALLERLRVQAPGIPEDPDDPLLRLRSEANLERLAGDALFFLDRKPEAVPRYVRSAELYRQAMAVPGAPAGLGTALAVVQWSLGGTLAETGRHAEALAQVEAAETAIRAVLALGPDAWSERMLGVLVAQRGEILLQLGRHDEAAALFAAGRGAREAAAAADPDSSGKARDLAVIVTLQARNELAAGRRVPGCAFLADALARWDAIGRRWGLSPLDERPLPEGRADYARFCVPAAPAG